MIKRRRVNARQRRLNWHLILIGHDEESGTRSINGRMRNQQLLAKEDRIFQQSPLSGKSSKNSHQAG